MIDELILEALEANERFWFIRSFVIFDRTDRIITIHLSITDELLIQV